MTMSAYDEVPILLPRDDEAELAESFAVLDRMLALDEVARLGAAPGDLADLVSFDPDRLLSPADRLRFVAAVERALGLLTAVQARATRAVAACSTGDELVAELHLEHELAVARRTSQYTAGRSIERARALGTTFRDFEAALARGEVSGAHCTVLVERTRLVSEPGALEAIAVRVIALARTSTPGAFGRAVDELVAQFDPDAAERRKRARSKGKRVTLTPLPDGLGMLTWVDSFEVVEAAKRTIDRDGRALQVQRRAGANASKRRRRKAFRKVTAAAHAADRNDPRVDDLPDADDILDTADATRADALAARVLGTTHDDGSVTWDRQASTTVLVEVLIDLATLLGEAERAGMVAGQPVPACVAREWAMNARLWRRMVTDPVTGHLLDYGRTTYQAEPLRRYVLSRDGGCRNPVCPCRSGPRLEADHALRFPDGPTSAANMGGLSTTCHRMKTEGFVRITDSRADGSATWTTLWGQTVRIPPRAYLADHERARPVRERPTVEPELDEPPF